MPEIHVPNQQQLAEAMHQAALDGQAEAARREAETQAKEQARVAAQEAANQFNQEVGRLDQAFEAGNQESFDDWQAYLRSRPATEKGAAQLEKRWEKKAEKNYNESLANTDPGYESMSMTELAKQAAEAELADDRRKLYDVNKILGTKVNSWSKSVKTDRDELREDAEADRTNSMTRRLKKVKEAEKARLQGQTGDQELEPEVEAEEEPNIDEARQAVEDARGNADSSEEAQQPEVEEKDGFKPFNPDEEVEEPEAVDEPENGDQLPDGGFDDTEEPEVEVEEEPEDEETEDQEPQAEDTDDDADEANRLREEEETRWFKLGRRIRDAKQRALPKEGSIPKSKTDRLVGKRKSKAAEQNDDGQPGILQGALNRTARRAGERIAQRRRNAEQNGEAEANGANLNLNAQIDRVNTVHGNDLLIASEEHGLYGVFDTNGNTAVGGDFATKVGQILGNNEINDPAEVAAALRELYHDIDVNEIDSAFIKFYEDELGMRYGAAIADGNSKIYYMEDNSTDVKVISGQSFANLPVTGGDRFIVLTDGADLSPQRVHGVMALADPAEARQRMMELSGSDDDKSVIVIDVE